MNRYNTTKKCPNCRKATSVLAAAAGRQIKHDGVTRDLFVTDRGQELMAYYLGHCDSALIVPCRGCGKLRVAHKVLGVVREHIKCDGRCMAATGHNCECSCGGANHGASHS